MLSGQRVTITCVGLNPSMSRRKIQQYSKSQHRMQVRVSKGLHEIVTPYNSSSGVIPLVKILEHKSASLAT